MCQPCSYKDIPKLAVIKSHCVQITRLRLWPTANATGTALAAAGARAVSRFVCSLSTGVCCWPAPPLGGVVALGLLRGLQICPWTPLKTAAAAVWVLPSPGTQLPTCTGAVRSNAVTCGAARAGRALLIWFGSLAEGALCGHHHKGGT